MQNDSKFTFSNIPLVLKHPFHRLVKEVARAGFYASSALLKRSTSGRGFVWRQLPQGMQACAKVWAAFRRLLDDLPWLKMWYLYLAFWPTVAFARAWALLIPSQRRLWDLVPGTKLMVGAVPLFRSDFEELRQAGVVAIINMCSEWQHDAAELRKLGFDYLWLPCQDMTAPTMQQCREGTDFALRTLQQEGWTETHHGRVLVHCKAGRGRSVIMGLCILGQCHNWSPATAMKRIRAARLHANDKSHCSVVNEFWAAGAGSSSRRETARRCVLR